ncbi:hypothetical protein L2E82_24464 [Cichorium intybus]|uniref:Uncharacterized protein n=1 Tax=Cichorium intybus TaxID=13427 RepID=A0ACB9E0U1_CICIN|nr:hypothetical protein L2E82_24464 [Cichorium intybus]
MEASPEGSSQPKLSRFFDLRPLNNQDFKPVESYAPRANVKFSLDIPLTLNGEKYFILLNPNPSILKNRRDVELKLRIQDFHHMLTLPINRVRNTETIIRGNLGHVLSTYVKPRLKWIPDLHEQLKEAANQLGGANKATLKISFETNGNSRAYFVPFEESSSGTNMPTRIPFNG